MNRRGTGHAIFALTILSAILLPSVFAAAVEPPITVTKSTLRLGRADIRVEVFEAPGGKERPVILVLHGAGGTLLDGPEMRRVSRDLAAAGNAVYLVRYFESTGTLFARDAAMQKNFNIWLATVRGAIVAIQQARNDSAPVGVYGYSLGGFLALAAASDNPRVGAVVEHAGGVWNSRMERIGKMPPVLMIHGKRDARVPFEKYAEPLIPVLRERGAAVETRFFSAEGHGFTPATMSLTREAAARFFRRHLPGDG